MSIFISYSHKDQKIVEPLANKIASIFGRDNIFFDMWSIQPGDSIIESMNDALTTCKFFLFFISNASLTSEMVSLEWRNALIRRTQNKAILIPIKLDNCSMPAILHDFRYIDCFRCGFDYALLQITQVISGNNTYKNDSMEGYQNIKAYITKNPQEWLIEFRAESYTEPHSRYLILLKNEEHEVEYRTDHSSMFLSSFAKDVKLTDGRIGNGFLISCNEATSPNFPFQVVLKSKGASIEYIASMIATSKDQYRCVPEIYQ